MSQHPVPFGRETSLLAASQDTSFLALTREWVLASARHRYTYQFDWLGVPVIQFPQDLFALQDIIWRTRPDVVLETGIAHGGSLVFSASILEMLGGTGRVIGVDVDIRSHNRTIIESHPLAKRIQMIQGSSTEEDTVRQVAEAVRGAPKAMVILDSNHTHDHVLRELQLYSPHVSCGCYLVVMDTVIEYMHKDAFPDRPWGVGNNPKTAVDEFLRQTDRFEIDRQMDARLQISVAPGGYLQCVKDATP